MLVPQLVLLKSLQNRKPANFRLRINGSWFLLKQHPRFMFSALHAKSPGEELLWFLGRQKKLACWCSSIYFRQGTQRPLFVQEGFSLDFIIKEVRILVVFVSTQPVSTWNSWWRGYKMYSKHCKMSPCRASTCSEEGPNQCTTVVGFAEDHHALLMALEFGWGDSFS